MRVSIFPIPNVDSNTFPVKYLDHSNNPVAGQQEVDASNRSRNGEGHVISTPIPLSILHPEIFHF